MNGLCQPKCSLNIKNSYWCQIIKKAEDDCSRFFYGVDLRNVVIFSVLFLKFCPDYANLLFCFSKNL